MKIDYLNREEGNSRLILIMAGWSTGRELYRDVMRAGWDVAVCHSYASLRLPEGVEEEWRQRYPTVLVYAWSFGVFVAMHALRGVKVTAAYALNGTGVPVDAEKGIAPAIFEGTLRGLNARSLAKFRRRMVRDAAEMQGLAPLLDAEPDIAALQEELRTIAAGDPVLDGGGLPWRRVFISEDDRIIPSEAQRRYWGEGRALISFAPQSPRRGEGRALISFAPQSPRQGEGGPTVEMLEGGHYVAMKRIVDWTLPRPEVVGDKFRAAMSTYNDDAKAQRIIAARLTDLIPHGTRVGRLLEIGAGAGLFTRMYSVRVEADEATYVDLCRPQEPFGIAGREEYVEGDAELWMDKAADEAYDMIVSASAIQWFADTERFFANARRVLRPGGRLAVSSFVAGNLAELDAVRPSPIPYRTVEELTAIVRGAFPEAEVTADEITLLFPSAREALVHLRRTGVGGSGAGTATLRALLGAMTPAEASEPVRLTFRPVWITATKS